MKHPVSQFHTLFPILYRWSTLPAFTGWISLTSGIIIAQWLPTSSVSSLYNNRSLYAIILSLLILIIGINKKITIRIIAFLITGILLSSLQRFNQNTLHQQLKTGSFNSQKVHASGQVVSVPLFAKRKYSFLLKVTKLCTHTETLTVPNTLFLCTGELAPPAYGSLSCSGQLYLPHPPANPYVFNEFTTFQANRICGRFRIDTIFTVHPSSSPFARTSLRLRTTVLETISHVTDPAAQGILQAAFLGEKNNLTPHIKSIFRDAGIYHLLAISGLHVAILIASIWLLLSIIPVPRVYKIFSAIFFIWCYLLFIGFIPSLFRAVVMATCILCATLFQRNNHAINALGLAGIIWLCMSPASLFTPGFQLSFAATFGIITLFPILNERLMPLCNNAVLSLIAKTFLTPFFVSCAGFIATASVLVYHFGQISLFGLFANIFAVLLMGLAMNTFFISIILQIFWEPLALITMWFTQFFLLCIITIAQWSQAIPWASLTVPVPCAEFFILYTLFFLGFVTINRSYQLRYIRRAALFLFLIIPVIIIRYMVTPYTEIVFFNTKRNPVIGIRFPNKKTWLITSTAGEPDPFTYTHILRPWLRHAMIQRLDAIIIPSVGKNVIHFLDPICRESKPEHVISGSSIRNDIVKENLDAYCSALHIKHIKTQPGWRFIPAPACTCAIYNRQKQAPWYITPEPAQIRLSCSGVQFSLNKERKPRNINSDNAAIQINNDAIVYADQIKGMEIFSTTSERTLCTDSSGAVVFRIYRNGKVRLKTMLSHAL